MTHFLHTIEGSFQTSLSIDDMFEISSDISKKYAPVQSTELSSLNKGINLSKKELLEVSRNISLYFAPKISSSFNKLVILPVDPEYFYIYWNIAEKHDFALSQSLEKKALVLRIYAKSVEKKESVTLKPVIEITIKKLQSGQKISLPLHHKFTVLSASIGQVMSDKTFESFLISQHSEVIEAKTVQKITNNNKLNSANIHSIDKKGKQMHRSGLDDNWVLVKSHYASTNYSAKGR